MSQEIGPSEWAGRREGLLKWYVEGVVSSMLVEMRKQVVLGFEDARLRFV